MFSWPLAMSLWVSASATPCLPGMHPYSYNEAYKRYPTLQTALTILSKQPIARWYTDRTADSALLAKQVHMNYCGQSNSSLDLPYGSSYTPEKSWDVKVVVVYGLPNKDCAAGFSSSGSNRDTKDYIEFIQNLVKENRGKVLYILEPDAIGLIADNGCGVGKEYALNLASAIELLVETGSDMYLDVGYWTLGTAEKARAVADIVKAVDPAKRVKGIVLNSANYRSTEEMNACCLRFQNACKGAAYKCIVDTSRNFLPPSTQNEWCNAKRAGIGALPTQNTGYPALDAFVWIKPAGESDGQCTGRTSDAMFGGPSAGDFYPQHFVELWNNGIFTAQYKYPSISMDPSAPILPPSISVQIPILPPVFAPIVPPLVSIPKITQLVTAQVPAVQTPGSTQTPVVQAQTQTNPQSSVYVSGKVTKLRQPVRSKCM